MYVRLVFHLVTSLSAVHRSSRRRRLATVKVMAPWAGKKIHEASAIVLHSFDPGFIDAAVGALERRNTLTVSVTERQLYLELNGATLSSAVHEHPVA